MNDDGTNIDISVEIEEELSDSLCDIELDDTASTYEDVSLELFLLGLDCPTDYDDSIDVFDDVIDKLLDFTDAITAGEDISLPDDDYLDLDFVWYGLLCQCR